MRDINNRQEVLLDLACAGLAPVGPAMAESIALPQLTYVVSGVWNVRRLRPADAGGRPYVIF